MDEVVACWFRNGKVRYEALAASHNGPRPIDPAGVTNRLVELWNGYRTAGTPPAVIGPDPTPGGGSDPDPEEKPSFLDTLPEAVRNLVLALTVGRDLSTTIQLVGVGVFVAVLLRSR